MKSLQRRNFEHKKSGRERGGGEGQWLYVLLITGGNVLFFLSFTPILLYSSFAIAYQASCTSTRYHVQTV